MKNAYQFQRCLLICFGATLLLTALRSSTANACSPVMAEPYDESAATDAAPPPVTITNIDIDLGKNFGESGPGDCSELGNVIISLEPPDGALLDEDFGAKINLISGDLYPLVDTRTLEDFVFPIENNEVFFAFTGDKDYVDITVTAQTVNRLGDLGPESESRSAKAEAGCGCNTIGTTPIADSSIWVLLLIALGL